MYEDDDMLMLSGIQHFRFCPRQWALIHIEQQWYDNRLTIEGQIMHKHVDDPFYRQKCGDFITLRAVNIASRELGLYGIADAIELIPASTSENTITHPKYPGRWNPIVVEYKHGKPKRNEVDDVQLAAQVMCLEEMYDIHIEYGIFFMVKFVIVSVWISQTPCVALLRSVLKACMIFFPKILYQKLFMANIATNVHLKKFVCLTL